MGEPIREIPEAARCLDCGYLLRGLTMPRCPECGRAFDPSDRRTMNLGRQMGTVARWWLRPAGRPLTAAAIVSSLVMLVAASAPGWYVGAAIAGYLLWIAVAAVWLVRLLIGVSVAWYYRQPTLRRRNTWLRWSIAPVVAAITFALLALRAPLYPAFWISRPAMDRLAQRVLAVPETPPESAWVGVFCVDQIEAIPGGVRFVVRSAGMFNSEGFAWSPEGEPVGDNGDDWYAHMDGPWYRWTRSWFPLPVRVGTPASAPATSLPSPP